MALADGIEGARYWAQQITWKDENGNALDLSGSTLDGFIRSNQTGTVRAIDSGALSFVTDGSDGVFNWAYGDTDVGEAGYFVVQFVADFGALVSKTLLHSWKVHEGLSTS